MVKEQILAFLQSEEPQVLAIQGRWGIGKTYLWNDSIEKHKSKVPQKKYSYVSLFGLKSVDDIKRTVFENSTDPKVLGEKTDLESIKKNYKALGKQCGRKSSNIVKDLSSAGANLLLRGLGSSVDKVFDSVATALLSETLICFDDIERHSKSVSLRDFLGLVSFLKEQKKCKIVILLNEDSSDLEEYQLYKEKVIDKQLHYEPSAKDCFDISKKLCIEANNDYVGHIKDVCERLDIRNIRVLKKIRTHIDTALCITEYDEQIKKEIVQSIIILCWCHYLHSSDKDKIPSVTFVKELNKTHEDSDKLEHAASIGEGDKENQRIRSTVWRDTLNSFGYQSVDPIVKVLLDSIEKGYIEKDKLTEICNYKQNEINIINQSSDLKDAWHLFHNSFSDNEDEVVDAFVKGMEEVVETATLSQYSEGLSLLKNLQKHEKATEMIKLYISENANNRGRFNVDNSDFRHIDLEDREFSDALTTAFENDEEQENPEQILTRLMDKQSYDRKDVHQLAALSSDELKTLFLSFYGEDLNKKIIACLMLAGSNENLMKNTKQALQEIGASSKLNKERLRKFNL
ncbi:P-loop NTPase fold protein [Vibrio ostreicida]|uniref:P-loop NTPase fold protein n=1 Tax=Vibrio ostreicida TaxID=526588 RepID=UPI003B59FA76